MAQSQTIETRTVQCINCGDSTEVPHLSEQPLELTFQKADADHPVIQLTAHVCSTGCKREVLGRVEAMA